MTVLVDTSVWVNLFRDQTNSVARSVQAIVSDNEIALTRFTQMELLQGTLNEQDWFTLSSYLEVQNYLEANHDTWRDAARIYYELRTQGQTVRSPIDCCIAQLAIEHRVLLVHEDRDFETIAEIRPLWQRRT